MIRARLLVTAAAYAALAVFEALRAHA